MRVQYPLILGRQCAAHDARVFTMQKIEFDLRKKLPSKRTERPTTLDAICDLDSAITHTNLAASSSTSFPFSFRRQRLHYPLSPWTIRLAVSASPPTVSFLRGPSCQRLHRLSSPFGLLPWSIDAPFGADDVKASPNALRLPHPPLLVSGCGVDDLDALHLCICHEIWVLASEVLRPCRSLNVTPWFWTMVSSTVSRAPTWRRICSNIYLHLAQSSRQWSLKPPHNAPIQRLATLPP